MRRPALRRGRLRLLGAALIAFAAFSAQPAPAQAPANQSGAAQEADLVARLRLSERTNGPDDPRTLLLVNELGVFYQLQGRYAEAEPLHLRALAGRERLFGRDHPITLVSVNNLASLYYQQGRVAQAEPLLRRALEAQERAVGRDHPDTTAPAINLALLYQAQGRNAEAEPLLRHALEIRERALGREHPDTLAALNSLAILYQRQARYAQAEPLYLRALAADERVLGRDHAETLRALNNLATLYLGWGRYDQAEPLFVRALEASGRVFGEDHPATLTLIANLAFLHENQGRYAEAEPLYQRAIEARERVLGRDHPDTLTAIGNLGRLYMYQGRFAEARPLFVRALEASERVLGRDSPGALQAADNLFASYEREGRYAEAAALIARVLAANERVRGRDHPETLMAASNLAFIYERMGRYAEAEPLYLRTLETRQRILGREHPDTIAAASGLARLRLSRPEAAASAIGPARLMIASVRARRIAGADDAAASAQRGREQRRQGDNYLLFADAAWAAAGADPPRRAALAGEAFTALQDATSGTTSQAVVEMAARRLADQAGAGLGRLVRERESLNEEWAVNSASYAAGLAGTDAVAADMRRTLPAERARIEARMAVIDATLRRDFPQYFALIRPEALDLAAAQAMLAPDEAILMVVPDPFGTHVMALSRGDMSWARSEWTSAQVDAAVRQLLWTTGAALRVTPEQEAELDGQTRRGYPRRIAFALYRTLVAPAAAILEGKRHVFIVAGGSLSSLPFGILVAEQPQGEDGDPAALRATRWFADAHALVQLPSIQSLQFLRRFQRPRATEGALSFVGFGDPIFQGAATTRGGHRAGRGIGAGTVDLRQLGRLNRLPGTAAELENMRRALQAPPGSLFLADRATEANLRGMDLSGTRVLALATHGLVAGEVSGVAEPGLVFTPPRTASDADDGYLTASEISALRLDADWVIMSACNTASGDGSAGAPGLSGLARAFFYAGARNLLASHWPVRDDVAARLTVRAVQLLGEQPGLSRAEALQRAMREIREDVSHDSNSSWADPSAWAPFTLIGDGAR